MCARSLDLLVLRGTAKLTQLSSSDRSLPTPAATPTSPEAAEPPRSSSSRTMAQPTDEQRKTTGDEPVAAERPRRHSIHSTSPTSTDQLPLPEVEPIIGAPADPEPRDSDPHRTDRPLESFDSLYEAISTVPMDHMTYPAELYYPIGGPSNPPGGAPPFAGQWGSPPPATPFGQGMQEYASAESVGRGERRTGRCKFFNALKVRRSSSLGDPPPRSPLFRYRGLSGLN